MHLIITVGKMQVRWAFRKLVIIPWYQYAEICSVFEEDTRVPLLQIPFFVSKVRKMTFWKVWIQLLDCKTARSSTLIPEHKPEDFTSRFSFSLVSTNWRNTERWNNGIMTPLSLLAPGWHFSCAVWTWRASYDLVSNISLLHEPDLFIWTPTWHSECQENDWP